MGNTLASPYFGGFASARPMSCFIYSQATLRGIPPFRCFFALQATRMALACFGVELGMVPPGFASILVLMLD